jgi:amino acid adenylation domain-containing protein
MLQETNVAECAGEWIPERFAKVAAAHADRVAVSTARVRWTYAQLDAASDSVAAQIDEIGSGEQRPVALLMDHDAPLVAAMLGVLKSGKPYVVLGDSDPLPRKQAVWERSDAALLLVDPGHAEEGRAIAGGGALLARTAQKASGVTARDSPAMPDAPASLTFTSGTTGEPKGVCQTHRGLLHHCVNYTHFAGLCAEDRVSLATPCHLAASLSSLFGALLNGATLLPFDLKSQGVNALPRWIESSGVTVLHLVPSAFRAMAMMVIESNDSSALRSLRLVRLGGEVVGRADFELFKRVTPESCKLLVAYSSTETGAACMTTLHHDSRVPGDRIPVGRPLPGMRVRVVDEANVESGAGRVGRIVIESRYLARGYWRDAELTAARFRNNREGPEVRVFETSDLGRFTTDGLLEHMGRVDARLKVRGQWVDPVEVEAALMKVPGVREAAVVGREDRVVAFVAGARDVVSRGGAIRRELRKSLPAHMVPSELVSLESLPRTAGGKIDRAVLNADTRVRTMPHSPFRKPTGLEARIGGVWSGALGQPEVGPDDDFYSDLGGTSLDAARVVTLLEEEFGRLIGLPALIRHPTPAALSGFMERDGARVDESSLLLVRQGEPDRPPVFFAHGDIFGGGAYCRALARQLGANQTFYSMSPVGLAELPGPHTVERMARHFVEEIHTIQSVGPYQLGGFCNGAFVAFEAARQLEADGQEVAVLALVRAYAGRFRWPGVLRAVDAVGGALGMENAARLALSARLLDHVQTWHEAARRGAGGIVSQGGVQLRRIRDKWTGKLAPPPPVPAPPDERSRCVSEIHRRAMLSYRQRKYLGRVLVFRAAGEESLVHGDPTTGWRRYAGNITPFVLPGEHFTCLTEHSDVLAEYLRSYLSC